MSTLTNNTAAQLDLLYKLQLPMLFTLQATDAIAHTTLNWTTGTHQLIAVDARGTIVINSPLNIRTSTVLEVDIKALLGNYTTIGTLKYKLLFTDGNGYTAHLLQGRIDVVDAYHTTTGNTTVVNGSNITLATDSLTPIAITLQAPAGQPGIQGPQGIQGTPGANNTTYLNISADYDLSAAPLSPNELYIFNATANALFIDNNLAIINVNGVDTVAYQLRRGCTYTINTDASNNYYITPSCSTYIQAGAATALTITDIELPAFSTYIYKHTDKLLTLEVLLDFDYTTANGSTIKPITITVPGASTLVMHRHFNTVVWYII